MIIRLHNIGAIGVIKDLPEHEMPPEAWTEAVNVRFRSNRIEKFKGHESVYDYDTTASGTTTLREIATQPWFAMPVQTSSVLYWIYAGPNDVYAATISNNNINLNKLDSTASATLSYSSDPATRWNGAVLAGLPYLTNNSDPLQVWTPVSASQRLQDAQWDASAGTTWATRTAGAVTCAVFRTYREFGIALKTTEGTDEYPRRLRWSHPVSSGQQPDSWEVKTTNDAGYKDFNETDDYIVDCAQLNDINVVYKQNVCWVMQYVGGPLVMSFRPLFEFGALTTECVRAFKGKHIVLTSDFDVILHNAQQYESIVTNKHKLYLQNDIDENYTNNCFVQINWEYDEIWICYPETGVSNPNWCTKALVWNWQTNTFTFRELPLASYIAVGPVEKSASDLTYDAMIGVTYDSTDLTYNTRGYKGTGRQMLMCRPYLSSSASGSPKLYLVDSTETFDDDTITSRLERYSVPMWAADRSGKIVIDVQRMKRIKAVYPVITAADGETFNFYIGTQSEIGGTVTWNGPYSFVKGTDRRINTRITGRYLAIRIIASSTQNWKLTGLELDVEPAGYY